MTASIIDKVVRDLGLEGIDWMDLTDEEAIGAIRLLLDEAENNPVYSEAFRSIWQGASTVLRRFEVVAQLAEANARIAAFEAESTRPDRTPVCQTDGTPPEVV